MQVEFVGGRLDGAVGERRSLPPFVWADDGLRFWRARPRRLATTPYRLVRGAASAAYLHAPGWRRCGACGALNASGVAVAGGEVVDVPPDACGLCGSGFQQKEDDAAR